MIIFKGGEKPNVSTMLQAIVDMLVLEYAVEDINMDRDNRVHRSLELEALLHINK